VSSAADSQTCFVVRTLLIHEYRRILLADPDLPAALLPVDWPGRTAAELTQLLYTAVAGGASHYAMQQLENAAGPLPAPADGAFTRFTASGADQPASVTSRRSQPRRRMR